MKKIRNILFIGIFICTSIEMKAQTSGSFLYDGITRSYIVYTPSSYVPGSSLPLVFVLHGFTQSAQNIMDVSGFNQVADTSNFIVVYPNGVGNAWNTNSGMTGGSTADDIGFLSALTDTMISTYGIDTTRVYSCGFSAGGYMSHRLACESSRCYAAVASVAGTMSSAAYSACNPSRIVSVMQIHGTSDAVVSYTGGFGGVSVDDVISKWTSLNVCPPTPVVTQLPNTNLFDNSTVERNQYSPCAVASEVELLKVNGGGHQWPGTTSLLGGLGTINRDINASREIWSFFRDKTCNTTIMSIQNAGLPLFSLQQVDQDHYIINTIANDRVHYVIYDLNGRVILSGSVTSGDIINVDGINHGYYVLHAIADHSTFNYRLIH